MRRGVVPRLGTVAFAVAGALAGVPAVGAHTGTTHAGTPHWVLLALFLLGVVAVVVGRVAVQRSRLTPTAGVVVLLTGVVVAGVGAIGLVEIQVVSTVGPTLDHLYPIASLIVGTSVMVGSLVATRAYWPDRPRYAVLGGLLGAWILYPNVLPNGGIRNPLGYVLVLGLPVAVGYVLRVDAAVGLRATVRDRFARTIGLVSGVLVAVIVAFSAGTVSVNPDHGVNMPAGAFVRYFPVADPLVTWPAVEFYVPSIPLAGMVSVGTVVLFGVLGGLVGLNVAVVAHQWRRGADLSLRGTLLGSLTTTGATACCCCAPAMYGVISAVFGTAASPVYWAFMDTSSPLSSAFLAASVLLLTGSLVHATSGPTGESGDLAAGVSL
ncbi:MAG: hypothetical protein ABEJ76_00825 [Halanaeroarchaeum sp.]